jgi:hypothetical protein
VGDAAGLDVSRPSQPSWWRYAVEVDRAGVSRGGVEVDAAVTQMLGDVAAESVIRAGDDGGFPWSCML